MDKGKFTLAEIMSQPQAWQDTLGLIDQHLNELRDIYTEGFEHFLFTGCGSTYYLAQAAAKQLTGLTNDVSEALPGSEIWLYPESSYNPDKRTLLIAISRSGKTTETIKAVEGFKKNGYGKVLTLSGYREEKLFKLGDLNLLIESAQEDSIAQTRAFSSLYLGILATILIWAKSDSEYKQLAKLPEICQGLLDNYKTKVQELGTNLRIERFYFLGSASRLGLANELSLKMKEMTLSHSEAFHCLEFRHGPMSMVNSSTLIIGLISLSHFDKEMAVLNEMREQGANVLSLAEEGADINFHSGLNENMSDILFLPLLQILAFERSLAKGLNPDRPNNLEAVVVLSS
ncbi:MAG TPA: SIS domain-containing protein [Trueperaceae bacterium]|nr:SIS domain-containing protein [Trueperaceae bacterium]